MNKPCIQRTIFVDHPSGEKSYGYRMYDDEGQTYNNVMGKDIFDMSPQEFLDKARESFDDMANSIFDFALEHGLYVDDCWYHFNLEDSNGPKLISPNNTD